MNQPSKTLSKRSNIKMKKVIDLLKPYKVSKTASAADDFATHKVKRISTGLFVLDLMTGGGIPTSRITEIYGKKSSGKSTLALRILGEYLKQHKNNQAVYADFEHTYEPIWASRFIAEKDMKRLIILNPDYAEEGIDILYELASQGEDLGLAVVDSVVNMIPAVEVEADADKSLVALGTKMVNKLLRKLIPTMAVRRKTGNEFTLITINQTRVNFDSQKFGPGVSKPGGEYHKFVQSLSIRMHYRDAVRVSGLPTQAKHEFVIEKNKMGLINLSEELFLNLVNTDGKTPIGSFDEIGQIIHYGKKAGIIQRAGAQWKFDGRPFKTIADLQDYILKPELYDSLKAKILEACLKAEVYLPSKISPE